MTRANIRYYEQEGLLAPARKENGYRSYSVEDCENLLKIKLLRQLQFSLQEIRDIQSGALSLPQAMEGRSALLEQESDALLNARDVCRRSYNVFVFFCPNDQSFLASLNICQHLDHFLRLRSFEFQFI